MSKLFFNKEEKLTLENNVLKENNLVLQIQNLQKEREGMIAGFCGRNSRKREELVNVNVQEGWVEFKDEERKESKAKRKK